MKKLFWVSIAELTERGDHVGVAILWAPDRIAAMLEAARLVAPRGVAFSFFVEEMGEADVPAESMNRLLSPEEARPLSAGGVDVTVDHDSSGKAVDVREGWGSPDPRTLS